MKIWSPVKLDSILERCDVPAFVFSSTKPPSQTTSIVPPSNKRSLSSLLQTERLHGTTTERDPTQKRHDYRYFSKQSYFVLVEDVRQELATIHALEYPIQRGADGKEQPAHPVLYCDPRSRGPFVKFDERERRRWEKAQKVERENENERVEKVARALRRKRQAEVQMPSRKVSDLRRSVSMNNLHRQAVDTAIEEYVDLDVDYGDGDTRESATASGYLASTGGAYVAASGNSVGITSTRGTTSNASGSFRTLELPASLRCRIRQQVVTSRKAPNANQALGRNVGGMGPPLTIPDHPNRALRKSRSTNTLRLPKRDEGSKPGYCESCRVKFDDFDSVGIAFNPMFMSPDDRSFSIHRTGNTVSLPWTMQITFNSISFSIAFDVVPVRRLRKKSAFGLNAGILATREVLRYQRSHSAHSRFKTMTSLCGMRNTLKGGWIWMTEWHWTDSLWSFPK